MTTTIASTAIAVRPGAVTTTTTITTIVSQNPCQTIITASSSLMNSPKPAVAATTATATATTMATVVEAANAGASFINLTTCNPQYLRSMQSSSYHRRHSVSGTIALCSLSPDSLLFYISHTHTHIETRSLGRDNNKQYNILLYLYRNTCSHLHNIHIYKSILLHFIFNIM